MAARNSITKTVLNTAIRILAGVGILSFLFGGRLIHAFAKTGFLLAELEGIGIAGICLILIVVAQHFVDDIPDSQDKMKRDAESTQK